jgi:hypothetical protein
MKSELSTQATARWREKLDKELGEKVFTNPNVSEEEEAPMPPTSYEEGRNMPMTPYEKAEAERIGLMGRNTNEVEWNEFCRMRTLRITLSWSCEVHSVTTSALIST